MFNRVLITVLVAAGMANEAEAKDIVRSTSIQEQVSILENLMNFGELYATNSKTGNQVKIKTIGEIERLGEELDCKNAEDVKIEFKVASAGSNPLII